MVESGQTLSARYTLVRRLGAGGHGEVWLAQDRERQGYAALKIIAPAFAQDPQALHAFTACCERVHALDHPHILKTTGLFRDGELAYIASEYAANGDFSLQRGRPAAEFISHLIAIAEALQYAHTRGVVHGDLKTTNVLIASDDRALLSDFAVLAGSPYNTSPQRLSGAAPEPADDVYGFGALLYELLCGYPPFYPQPTPERVIHEPVPALVPRYPAPLPLIELALQCLAKDSEQRPVFSSIIDTLRASAAEIRSAQRPATAAGAAPQIVPPSDEALRPQWRRSDTAATATRRTSNWRRPAAFVALGILSAAVVGVFVLLPRWAHERNGAQTPTVVAQPAPSTAAKAEAEKNFAELAVQKQAAEELRGELADRWNKLQEQAVERWATDAAAIVKQAFASGDESMAAREYGQAKEHFDAAGKAIAELERDYPTVLAAKLKEGAAGLEEGDSAKAKAAFELALAMSPNEPIAKVGLKRAQSLDQVRALLATARTQEQSSQWSQALATYRQALQLDPQTQAASAAISRIESQLTNDAFGRAMARGYQQLNAGQFAAARDAFEEARKIRPQAPEITQALNDVQQSERTREIEARLKHSSELEAGERWVEALAELKRAAQLDANVAAVKESIARVEPRARLHEEFELYLTQPERLFAPAVRRTARASIDRARGLQQQGPVLRAQVDKVEAWLKRAETPVRVSLQSDNETRVTIYRVGELGTFTERSVELAPGKYVAVGTRPGYRDVRREFALVPGETPAPIVIRCEDRV